MSLVELGIGYYPDPTQGRPVFNGEIYVGFPDTDPEIQGNQKPITLRQQSGVEIPGAQPVKTSSGGVPIFQNSPIDILVDGNYSLKVLNNKGIQVYYVPNSANIGGTGGSGLLIEEEQTLANGDTEVIFGSNLSNASVYVNHDEGLVDMGRMKEDLDYSIDLATNTVTLFNSYPDGTVLSIAYNEASTSEPFIRYIDTVEEMKAQLWPVGVLIQTQGFDVSGGPGAGLYLSATPQATDGFVNHTASNGNALLLVVEGVVNVAQVGADPNLADNKLPLEAAFALGKPLFVPEGVYLTSGGFTATADVFFEKQETTRFQFLSGATGWLLTVIGGQYSVTTKNLTLRSSRTDNSVVNQSGVRFLGNVMNIGIAIRTEYFDLTHFQLAEPTDDTSGIYWSRFSEIRCILLAGQTCANGVYTTGREVATANLNSNANMFVNTVTSGAFSRPIRIGGNNNRFIGGTVEWTQDGALIDSVYTILGAGNLIEGMYIESTDQSKPVKMVEFGEDSKSNEVSMWVQFNLETNLDAYIDDQGLLNKIDLPYNVTNISSYDDETNYFKNAKLSYWDSATSPYGYTDQALVSEETIDVFKGEASSIKMTLASNAADINCYFIDTDSNSKFNYPAEFFQGEDIVVGVMCKTTLALYGGIKITILAPSGNLNLTGNSRHSGSGEWELLTAVGQIPIDATQIIVGFSSHLNTTAGTGTILFAAPTMSKGRRVSGVNRYQLSENGGDLLGVVNAIGSGGYTLESPDGSTYRIDVDNAGVLSTTLIP